MRRSPGADDAVDFETDVRQYPEVIALFADDQFCAEFWTAFANQEWFKSYDPLAPDDVQIAQKLTADYEDSTRWWGASFRGMGGIIAEIRNEFHGKEEDYMTWYCSNMRYVNDHDNTMSYGWITDRVREAMLSMGWEPPHDNF